MTQIERRHSNNGFLESVLDSIYNIADIGYIRQDFVEILTHSEKKIEVSFPLKLDNGEIRVFTGGFVQHSTILGPSIGSVEIISDATIDDCEALAILTTLETAVLGIPMGGSKGVIFENIADLNKDETERMYKAFITAVLDMIGPDRNVIKLYDNSSEYTIYPIIDIVEKKCGNIKSVVNRPEEYFGTGLIKRSQAFSVAQCVKKVIETYANKEIADINVGITMNDEKFDVDLLIELNNLGLSILGFATDDDDNTKLYREKIWSIIYNNDWESRPVIRVKKCNMYPASDEESILTSNVDILVLQDTEIKITADVAEKIKAKFIIEAEENVITSEAETILEDNGVIIIPDYISLGGVFMNGYIEWIYGTSSSIMSNNDWKNTIAKSLNKSLDAIFKIKDDKNITTREASVLYALQRIIDIMDKKGFN